jgi:cell division protein FtsQ
MAKAKATITPAKKKNSRASVDAKKPQSKKAAASRERERKKQRERRKRTLMSIGTMLVVLVVMIGAVQRVDLLLLAMLRQGWVEATAAAGFTFRELVVEGRTLTPPEQIVEAVGLAIGDSLFTYSLDDMHTRLLNLPMVRSAYVSRDLSGRIIVTLHERTPFALWQYRDTLRVVDEEGIVLLGANPDDYPNLITVVGEHAPEHMDELVSFLTTDEALLGEVVAAVYVSNRRWDVHFVSNVQIMLPEDNPRVAWEKLAQMQKDHAILEQKLQAIDLRVDGKIYITLPDAEKTEYDENNASNI